MYLSCCVCSDAGVGFAEANREVGCRCLFLPLVLFPTLRLCIPHSTQNYCMSDGVLGTYLYLNDCPGGQNLATLYEFDIPGYQYHLSTQVGNEVFLRGTWVEAGLHALGSFGTA